MKLAIGENIKSMRKSKELTQEALAEMLGVSCQSVSRWELGTCYPDMELLPVIAAIFDVSVDKLLGVDDVVEKRKVNEYLERFQTAINKGEVMECIAVAREGVAEYPNNFALLNKLMYALFLAGDEDGNIADWKENMENYDNEIIALGERIMKYCPDQEIRLEATSRLAFQHCEMGRKAIGRSVYEMLPSQVWCRESQMWWGLEEEEKLPFLRRKLQQEYEGLYASICMLARSGCLPDKESVAAMKKIVELEDLICDGNHMNDGWGVARLNCDMARIYARLEEDEKVYEHLRIAAKATENFDNRPELQSFSSLLLGTIELKKIDFETSDTRSLCEIMRDKWLAGDDFNRIRNTEEFKEIIQAL